MTQWFVENHFCTTRYIEIYLIYCNFVKYSHPSWRVFCVARVGFFTTSPITEASLSLKCYNSHWKKKQNKTCGKWPKFFSSLWSWWLFYTLHNRHNFNRKDWDIQTQKQLPSYILDISEQKFLHLVCFASGNLSVGAWLLYKCLADWRSKY